MCGICGKFNVGTGESVSLELIKQMANVLRHRGPDGEGFYVDGSIGLGHRRLKIIDLETGQQPMFNEDGSLVVILNGEIYNFVELRRELQTLGHHFRTKSDTEVLLHGYEEWGDRLLQRLRGMFAFAIWDHRKRELFLARDRIGIKPLYYYWNGNTLLFASEIKSILEDAEVRRVVEPTALDDFLTYMYIPAPKTIFKNIYKLRAGHFLKASAAGIQMHEYWDIDFSPNGTGDENEYAAELLEQLKESVRLHLVSEVPLGAFLSGGLDSSAVVGLMNEVVTSRINTASIGFREAAFDELPYARMVANRFHTNAHERVVDARAAKVLGTLVWHFDEPFADDSMVPAYYVSQTAREKVTVCLSGDGGDENFAGYRRYRFDVLENRIRALLPERISRPVFAGLAGIYPKADWLPQVFRAKTLLTNLSCNPEQGYFNTMSWLKPAAKHRLYNGTSRNDLSGYEPISIMQEHFARTNGWDPLSRIQYVDIKTYLVDDILTKVDRTSMAHALEVRVPILDHQVMEYAAQIPACYKLRNGGGKYILKKAVHEIVPPQIIRRRKQGFSVPLADWLRKDLKNTFEQSVLSPHARLNNWFEPKAIADLWSRHQRGTRDHAHELWALLVLEHWGGRFLAS